MKLLLIADLHICANTKRLIDILQNTDYDHVILLGDNQQYDLDVISQNVKKDAMIYGILGNHNRRHDFDDFAKIVNVHQKLVVLRESDELSPSLSVVGLEGSMRYKQGDFPMYDDDEVKLLCRNLPVANILISHTGPSGLLGASFDEDVSRRGFKGLNGYIMANKPKYYFFGHYHKNVETVIGKTKCYCVYGVSLFDTKTDIMTNLYCEDEN